jgi:hypothetical protein
MLIKQYGCKTVEPILERIKTLRESGRLSGSSFHHLLSVLEGCAQREHQKQIVEILLCDEICLYPHDRTYREHLFNALKKIGDISVVNSLEECAEKIKGVNYYPELDDTNPDPDDIDDDMSNDPLLFDGFIKYSTREKLQEMDQKDIRKAITGCLRNTLAECKTQTEIIVTKSLIQIMGYGDLNLAKTRMVI